MINLKSRDSELKEQGDNNLIIQEHRRPNNAIIMHTNQTLTNKYSVNYIIVHMLPMLEINDYGKQLSSWNCIYVLNLVNSLQRGLILIPVHHFMPGKAFTTELEGWAWKPLPWLESGNYGRLLRLDIYRQQSDFLLSIPNYLEWIQDTDIWFSFDLFKFALHCVNFDIKMFH